MIKRAERKIQII
jgi:phosphatidylserine/phosphatidylglycerophosphate/cardiolipin synthase-like enzyme